MPRKLRSVTPGAIAHVTNNINQGQYLFTPDPELNELLVGVWRKNQERHGMRVLALVILSNHYHALLAPESANQLADFMHDVQLGMYHAVNGQRGTPFGRFYAKRYALTECLDSASVLHDYAYILSNSVAENLVEDPRHWPGVHSATELCGGTPQSGRYLDRDAYQAAKAQNPGAKEADFWVEAPVKLTPIPQHRGLSVHQRETANRKLVQKIVREHAASRGQPVAGAAKVLAQNPFTIPKRVKVTPLVRWKAKGPSARELIDAAKNAYAAMVEAYYVALETFCSGRTDAQFPSTCYAPYVVQIAVGDVDRVQAVP